MMDAPYRPERFDGAVDHYAAARLDYTPGFIAWLVRDTGAKANWTPHEDVLIASTFNDLRAISVYQTHAWTFERLLRNTLSRSATTEALLAARRSADDPPDGGQHC